MAKKLKEIRMKRTREKIEEMKRNNEPVGCNCCLGFFDDGEHEYDPSVDMFYCPAMD